MKTLEMILEIIEARAIYKQNEIEKEILEAFYGYEYDGVSKIKLTKNGDRIEAHADANGAPVLVINLECGEKNKDIVAVESIYIKK